MTGIIPSLNELDHRQRSIVQHNPFNDSFFIEGPPGSGKTMVALHRTQMMLNNSVTDPLFLIYNKSLLGFLKYCFKRLGIRDNITIRNKDQFFVRLARQHNVSFDLDWDYETGYVKALSGLKDKITGKPREFHRYGIIILDEIQDFWSLEWDVLKNLSEKFLVLGDFDQKIRGGDMQRDRFSQLRHQELPTIYRFGRSIAGVAQSFSETNLRLENKVTKTNDQKVFLGSTSDFGDFVTKIGIILRNNFRKDHRIAIVAPDHDFLTILHSKLKGDCKIEAFYPGRKTGEYENFDFSSKQPVLFTLASVKGLEFETVIICGFNKSSPAVINMRLRGTLRKNLYVALTRANSSLYVINLPDCIPELKSLDTRFITTLDSREEIVIDF